MHDTIYWAVLIDDASKSVLTQHIKPKHPNVYLEHVTIVFKPNDEQNSVWERRLGEKIELEAIAIAADDKGEALVVDGVQLEDSRVPHITVSCAEGVKPFYSNELLAKGHTHIWPFPLTGVIAKYTKQGWVTSGKV